MPVNDQRGRFETKELPIKREAATGRAVLDLRAIHIADMQAEWKEYPLGRENALRLGHRTILTVPLIRVGESAGELSGRVPPPLASRP